MIGDDEPMRILLVEDEVQLAEVICDGLREHGIAAELENDGRAGLWRAREGSYDVIVLDIMVPGINGYRICSTLREEGNWTPIIMLTAKDGEWDEAEALDSGADDFLSKPFSFRVLMARLRALARRTPTARPAILEAGDLQYDLATKSVRRGTDELRMSRTEMDVLEVLMRAGGTPVSKQKIFERVWGFDTDVDPKIVEVYIRYLRRKIDEPYGAKTIINTTRCRLPNHGNDTVNRPNFKSVRSRATLAATIVTALVLGLASVLILELVERDLESNARAALNDALEVASHSASGEQGEGSKEGETEYHEGARREVSESDEETTSGQAISGDGGSSGDVRQQQITDTSIQKVQAGVDAASRALLIIVPVVAAFLAAAIWFTVGRTLRPVRDISRQVAGISGSTLNERVPEPDSEDEIAELAALMNEMLDRLEDSADRQRAFVADASHELRSPLSTIVASAEIAQISADPQKLQQLAAGVGSEAQRMQTLIADLLDLARLDEDRHQRAIAPVELVSMCRETIERIDFSGIEIDLNATGPIAVDGVGSLLERAVSNLIDNATTHAERCIRVHVKETATAVAIVVEDDGPGIPEVDRLRVFERFARLDESRERNTGGSGLGLALGESDRRTAQRQCHRR